MVNGQFAPLADVNIPPGTYTQIKIITSRTFGVKGYILYNGTYYYTKNTTSQEDIGSSATIPTSLSAYGTQTTTITDPGSGSEIGSTYEGATTFRYTSNINLQINFGQKPNINVEFLADQYLELNDSTTSVINNGAPAAITFGAPELDVSTS